jgi:LysM repeat protein
MIALVFGQTPITVRFAEQVEYIPHANQCKGIAIPGTPIATPTTAVTTSQQPTATAPSPTQDGLISTCNNFYKAVKGDTCAKIVQSYGNFDVAQFTQWNPAVGDDCSGLWAQTYYCVGVPCTPTVRPSSSAPVSTTPAGPSPTQDGIISTCTRYHKAVSGDTCQKIVDQYGTFSSTQFRGLWLGYYYCIGVPGTPTVKPTSSTPKPTGCTASVPTPTQPGAVCACKKWHKVASGNTCATIEKLYSITAASFNNWNPQVGSNCSALWLGYNVCVSA